MPKVLLVEDNALNRKMLDRRLRHSGYEVLVAINGEEAVAMAIDKTPDLILMATDLPVMGGWQAIKILKASAATRKIPVIALTSNANRADNWKTALQVGCDDYEIKPIVLKRLVTKIDTLLGSRSFTESRDSAFQLIHQKATEIPAFSDSEISSAVAKVVVPSQVEGEPSDGLLNARFKVNQVLSTGKFGQRLLATDLMTSTPVVINAFNLPVDTPSLAASVRSFLASEMRFLELISQQDDMSSYIDHFEQGDVFYWAQSQVVGDSLADELGSAQSMGHVLTLTHSLLTSLNLFHQGNIVHCECNPHSFMRRQSDGRVVLVEYGLLQRMFVALRSQSLAYRQVILGQRHYQPAEQRAGNLQLSSDIYAVGMIALQSLTGQSPDWLVEASGQRNLTTLVKADAEVVKLFERMVSPNQKARFQSATEALAALPLGLIPKPSMGKQSMRQLA